MYICELQHYVGCQVIIIIIIDIMLSLYYSTYSILYRLVRFSFILRRKSCKFVF